MACPDFLIIGAMKCATSTLAAQLAAQPGIFMATPKEPNFFSDDAIYARGTDWYRGLFAAAPPGALLGEASTHYTKLPTYPLTIGRMASLLNAPKLIYMIRNPVARAVSHYIHDWSQAHMGDDMAAAFDTRPDLVDYGRYAMQIAPFIDAFGVDQIYLTSLEQIKADGAAELTRIGAFLGLATPPVWQADLAAQNVSADRVRRFPLQGLLIDNPLARSLRRTLVPKALRSRIRSARTIGARPELSEAVRVRLEKEFTADRTQLAQLFPGHPALTLSYPFLTP